MSNNGNRQSEQQIVGLVPAAGRGLRLGLPYPKELYPIIVNKRYKPVSQFVIDNLVEAGVGHVVIVVNETKHQLIGYFGDGHRFGTAVSYVVQENSEPGDGAASPGLAHALDAGFHLIRGHTVFFGMPDTIMEPEDVFSQLGTAASEGVDLVLGLFPTERPEKFGMVRCGPEGRVLEIVDKPRDTDLVDMWGCMVWRPAFSEYLHECVAGRGMRDFALILNTAVEAGFRVRGYRVPGGVYRDLGTYDEIREYDRWQFGRQQTPGAEGPATECAPPLKSEERVLARATGRTL